MPHALIVGAGIAGDTLAVLLERDGWRVTVVELAPALRGGGQTVDLRGDCREVLARMDLLDATRARLLSQRGAAWVNAAGRRLASMPVTAFGGRGFISSEELLRSDLARLLHAACGPRVNHRFADTVEALEDTATGIRAHLRSGERLDADLVVGADGTHSRVRALRFGPEEHCRKPLGLAHAWFTLDEHAGTPPLDGWALIYNAPGRRKLLARPGHPGQQEIGLTFAADTLPPRHDRDARQTLLERTFADAGWRARELLDAARLADDFALDLCEQIHLPRWHDGRVVLLGDSAWCSSPLSGLGTAMALRGAAELATCLHAARIAANPSRLPAALAAFEQTMRPRATRVQHLPPGRIAAAAPRTALGIRCNAWVMRAVQSPLLRPLVNHAIAHSEYASTPPRNGMPATLHSD